MTKEQTATKGDAVVKLKHIAKSYKGNRRTSKCSRIVTTVDTKEEFFRSIKSLAARSTLHTNVVVEDNLIRYSSWDASDVHYVDIYKVER